MMIVLLLFLQKQNLANAIYLFGLGTLLKDRQKQYHWSEGVSCELRRRGLGYALEFQDGRDSMQQGGARQGGVEIGGHKSLG